MKVTFPHMGSFYVGMKALFEALDIEVIVPPPITKKTMNLGNVHGPESACLPLKINLGNFLESIEKGADTVVMAGGHGPCRFGYYAQVHREILKDLGYDINVIVIEQPRTGRQEFFRSIKANFPNKSWYAILSAVFHGWQKIKMLDELEEIILRNRAFEVESGAHSKFWKKAVRLIDQTNDKELMKKLFGDLKQEVEDIPKKWNREVLHIAIVGEIYLLLEPSANHNVEEKLGNLGVSITRTEYVSDYISENVFKTKNTGGHELFASRYLKNKIGGHGYHTVANAVKYARKGYDGIIQIMPFTCTPEIVSMSILNEISEKEDIPILSLIFDEHSGEAGVDTRIEAFVDLIRRKQRIADANPNLTTRENLSLEGV
ncbi:hypothetical protein BHU72_02630 [Desulfuribacillus stibiiarsenatis]|uniref:CoA protein activase n=1 Tax=Desulfuribacillus stibiiarsenatis TaxID=1390249 RepID=A0A1E5L6M7_9FIRM|nr:2-hydroxyacyl-CoA dehydratase [Desulfuribacillus stibiiarsenatis]OEH85708.1 hypothetical protein BHU72_02630 [Desulfuribacillus stibiiarsenatis]